MKKNRSKLGDLFYNDRFVMGFSVLAAVILWFIVASTSKDLNDYAVVGDIPISIELSQNAQEDGLQVFEILTESGSAVDKASVRITGNRLMLQKVSRNDIQVTARDAASVITDPGTYELRLTAQKVGVLSDYSIDDNTLSPSTVKVLVDRKVTKEITLENNIQYSTDLDYYATSPQLIPDKVTITGAESMVSKVKRAVAEYTVDEQLTESKSFTVPIVLYDENNQVIPLESLENQAIMSVTEVQADFSVLKKQVVPVKVSFTNLPSGWSADDVKYTVSPEELQVAAPADVFDSFTEIKLESIDFSKVSPSNNEFDLTMDLPAGCKSLSNVYNATVKIDTSGIGGKTLSVNRFTFRNQPANKDATVYDSTLQIQVYGPVDLLEKLTPDNVYGVVDLKDQRDFTGHTEMPVQIYFENVTGCWAYGEYKVNVRMAEKTASSG
jgi:YbbR domain-containing protein